MIKATKKSKADAIRSHMAANPDASPTDVADALKKAGYKDVTPQYVSTIKSMDKRKANGPTRRGPLSGDDLMTAKAYVGRLGGIGRAREAIEILEKLR